MPSRSMRPLRAGSRLACVARRVGQLKDACQHRIRQRVDARAARSHGLQAAGQQEVQASAAAAAAAAVAAAPGAAGWLAAHLTVRALCAGSCSAVWGRSALRKTAVQVRASVQAGPISALTSSERQDACSQLVEIERSEAAWPLMTPGHRRPLRDAMRCSPRHGLS